MNPEEKELLERSWKLARENNDLLKRIDARGRRASIYGFIKLVIIIAPLVIGYFFLEPYFGQASATLRRAQDIMVHDINIMPR